MAPTKESAYFDKLWNNSTVVKLIDTVAFSELVIYNYLLYFHILL